MVAAILKETLQSKKKYLNGCHESEGGREEGEGDDVDEKGGQGRNPHPCQEPVAARKHENRGVA